MAFSLLQFAKSNILLVNVVGAMLCALLADAIVQFLYDRPRTGKQAIRKWSYNPTRTARLVVVAGLLGFVTHKWYVNLDNMYTTTGTKDLAAKIVLDEIIMAPLAISSYIFVISLLEGKSMSSIYEEWKRMFSQVYMVDVFVWPVVQIINFMLVPIRFRLFYINICSLAWNIFLSYCKHSRFPAPIPTKHIKVESSGDRNSLINKETDDDASESTMYINRYIYGH